MIDVRPIPLYFAVVFAAGVMVGGVAGAIEADGGARSIEPEPSITICRESFPECRPLDCERACAAEVRDLLEVCDEVGRSR